MVSELITPDELADELGVTRAVIYRWMKDGRLPYQCNNLPKRYFIRSQIAEACRNYLEDLNRDN